MPGKRVMLCWELGAGTGHVYPYLSLLTRMQSEGWNCAVAARNTAEVNRAVDAAGISLFQAPLCLSQFGGLGEHAFNYTEIMLHNGYAMVETLFGMFNAWCNLFSAWQPSLVIGSAAPTAMLAANVMNIPRRAIGAGFNCPPPMATLPLLRPWQQGIEMRINNNEQLAKRNINTVLEANNIKARNFSSDMFDPTQTLLFTCAELDPYAAHRSNAHYFGLLPQVKREVQYDAIDTSAIEIFAYLRLDQHTEKLLQALSKRGEKSLVYCPNLSEAMRVKWTNKQLSIAASPIDVAALLPTVRLVISYAGHNLTLETLLAGKPLLLMPTHLEQSLNAQCVVRLGAGLVVGADESRPKFSTYLDQLLLKTSYADAAMQFAQTYRTQNPDHSLDRASSFIVTDVN